LIVNAPLKSLVIGCRLKFLVFGYLVENSTLYF
jgi:hypothetical protein